MNTPSHMLIGAAVFARPLVPATLVAALAGGLAPDLPMFVMVVWSTRLAGVPEHEVFSTLFFSESWQTVFAVDHGFLVWGALLGLAIWRRDLILRAFAGAGLLHAAVDFLTHNDDARRQFWPVSDWVFRSPVSYWDARFYGDIFGVFEVTLVVALTAVLCLRLGRWRERVLLIAIAALVVVPIMVTGGLHGLHGMG
ncbi:MAG: cobalamin biosynthesis protein CobQ [Proteobacteria bacterium]|nr:cobalamin biosynthesis protein CobQ [Pseudomonadota bacterium]